VTFRIGIIGAGTHGARYLRHGSTDVPGLVPLVICRRDRNQGEALAKQWQCRYLAESDAVATDPQVDGVVVCTPPSTHFPFAKAVLAAGKALLLEKPMTGTLDEARQLAALDTAASAPPLMVAQTLRWNPAVLRAQELWSRLGRVHMLRLVQRLPPTNLSWQRDQQQSVGGSVLLTGVHMFDLVRFLTGQEVVEVDSRQRHVMNPVTEDHFLTRAVLSDGCWVTFEVSKYTQSRACWLEAVGEEGQLQLDYYYGGLQLRRGREVEQIAADAQAPTLPAVLRDWLETVRAGTPPPVTVHDGLRTMEIVAACYRSHRDERPIALAEIQS
jgi:predicted dehydrogenase